MFLCKTCVDKTDGDGHFEEHVLGFGVGISHGKCEVCEQVSDCVDCKCYKGRP